VTLPKCFRRAPGCPRRRPWTDPADVWARYAAKGLRLYTVPVTLGYAGRPREADLNPAPIRLLEREHYAMSFTNAA
jgi:hypothetical protein